MSAPLTPKPPESLLLDEARKVTVADVLELPALRRGLPEVVAGKVALERQVRWVHVLDVQDPSDLLRGGELVLSTGFGAGKDPKGQQRFVEALAKEGASGLVIELGWTFDKTLPRTLLDAADACQLPVIALHRQLRFVEVTEAIHSVLLDRQLSLLRRADELQDRFIEIVLGGEGATSVLADLSRLIGNPVVLEDHSQRLVELALHEAGRERVLTAWEQHHRAEDRQDRSDADSAVAEVPVRGRAWGRLIALAVDGPIHESDRLAVDRAAIAVALDLLSEQSGPRLRARARGGLIAGLAHGRLEERDAARWAASLGFPRRHGALLPAAAVWRTEKWAERAETEQDAWDMVVDALPRTTISGRAVIAGTYGDGVLLALDLGQGAERPSGVLERAASELRSMLEKSGLPEDELVLALGRPADSWSALGASLDRVVRAAAAARTSAARPWHDARRGSIVDLLFGLRTSVEMVTFVREQLGPLLDERDARASELLRTLEIYLEKGGRKAEAARALHLERQSLYGRLERIEKTLEAPLDDPDMLLGLHLAVRALRLMEADGDRPRPLP
ncbi:MAG: PucR family transcriptional regulator [Solirubrobacteraceae bacterium]|nr:PucR family transcriptional regulator [Solirubrobacteraceae bacterium]